MKSSESFHTNHVSFCRLPVRASTDGTSNDSPLGIICSVASVKGSKWSKSRNFYRISTFSKGYLDIEKIWWYLNMQKSRWQTEEAEVEAVGYTFQGWKFSNSCHKQSEKLHPHLLNDSPVIWMCCIKLWGHNSHSGLALFAHFLLLDAKHLAIKCDMKVLHWTKNSTTARETINKGIVWFIWFWLFLFFFTSFYNLSAPLKLSKPSRNCNENFFW